MRPFSFLFFFFYLSEAVSRQVEAAQPVEADDGVVGSGRMPRRFQRVHRQVQADQVRQRQVRPLAQAHVGQIQLLDALQVVEQLFEVGPQRVVTLVPSMPKQQKNNNNNNKTNEEQCHSRQPDIHRLGS